MKNETLEEAAVLIAINECIMDSSSFENENQPALIIGKEYVIKKVTRNQIVIESEVDTEHYFDIETIEDFFKVK